MSKVIEFLKPPSETPPFIHCTWKMQGISLYPYNVALRRERTGLDGSTCGRASTIKIDGKWYCKTHAKSAALEYLIKEQSDIVKK